MALALTLVQLGCGEILDDEFFDYHRRDPRRGIEPRWLLCSGMCGGERKTYGTSTLSSLIKSFILSP